MTRKFMITVLALAFGTSVLWGQTTVTAPTAIDFASGAYQTTAQNIFGTALKSYGYNLNKKQYLSRPIRITVRVQAVSADTANFRSIVNYFGQIDTVFHRGYEEDGFYVPDSSSGKDLSRPDSLFYIRPDSAGITAGNYFTISNTRIRPGDLYNFRLVFSPDSVRGTATHTSQPVWIGYGVRSLFFGVYPNKKVAAVYRTLYATSWGGAYSGLVSSDTLADSAYTSATLTANQWNYQAVTGMDTTYWMKVERIGKEAADTAKLYGEQVIIQSF